MKAHQGGRFSDPWQPIGDGTYLGTVASTKFPLDTRGNAVAAVIVSCELGIPAVVSVTGATRIIPNGALIEVDGGAGTVTILELP